jgi:CheY-like chemotaxis protein
VLWAVVTQKFTEVWVLVSADKRNINDLIALIERNKVAQGQTAWYKSGDTVAESDDDEDEEDGEEGEEGESEADFSDVRLLVFASTGPFTESFFPMLEQHEQLVYAITDVPEEAIDIAINNPQIRHVLIDMDRPSDPTKGVNVFADLKTLNPGILIFYCTKNPSSIEARSIQTKGAKLIQKPVLRKTVDQFVSENFNL